MVQRYERNFWAALEDIHKVFFLFPKNGEKYEHDSHRLIHLILMFLLTIPYMASITASIYKLYSDGLGKEMAEPSNIMLFLLGLIYVFVTFLLLREKFQKLLDKMNRVTPEVPEKIVKAYLLVNRLTWILALLCVLLSCTVGFYSYWTEVHCEGRKLSGDKRYVCGLHHYAWFPFIIEEGSWWKDAITLYVIVTQATLVVVFVSTMVGLMAIPWIISLRIRDLREQIEKMDAERFTAKFVLFVEYYSWIFECINDMNGTIGYILVFEYTIIIPIIATVEYITLQVSYENGILLVLVLIFQYCLEYIGQNLETEHELLVRAVSFIPWYEMTPKMRKNYNLFLGKVGIPIHCRAYPFVEMNNEHLLSILQKSYTLATYLMNSSTKSK